MLIRSAILTVPGALSIVLAVLVAFLAYRVIQGTRAYFRFRGSRILTCPETQNAAVVKVAAESAAFQAIVDEPCLRLSNCSRWPIRKEYGQDCLRHIEPASSELRFSAACRPS